MGVIVVLQYRPSPPTKLINECYNSTNYDPNSSRVSKIASTSSCTTKDRTRASCVIGTYDINQSIYETTGFDIIANYFFDSLFIIPGTLNLNILLTK